MVWPEWTATTMFYCDYMRTHAGTPGHNRYGVPLHACNGHKQDAHVWAYYSKPRTEVDDLTESARD